jgi:hypothetical protein
MKTLLKNLNIFAIGYYMYKECILYNWWHQGDLFHSREFVKALMKIIPAEKFSYAHRNNPRTFIDIPNLGYTQVTEKMRTDTSYLEEDNILYINTHNIGKYLCTVDSYYIMYNMILEKLGLGSLPGTELDYIPDIDYTKFEIAGVNEFMSVYPNHDKVLICNGDVQSGQMTNFSFATPVQILAKRYPTTLFLITSPTIGRTLNILYTGDITKTSDGFDIYEISFLSTFCRVLVGRYSGPHTCSQVKQNWFDPTKRLVTFTHGEYGNTTITNPNVAMKKFWSPSSKDGVVIALISQAMESR